MVPNVGRRNSLLPKSEQGFVTVRVGPWNCCLCKSDKGMTDCSGRKLKLHPLHIGISLWSSRAEELLPLVSEIRFGASDLCSASRRRWQGQSEGPDAAPRSTFEHQAGWGPADPRPAAGRRPAQPAEADGDGAGLRRPALSGRSDSRTARRREKRDANAFASRSARWCRCCSGLLRTELRRGPATCLGACLAHLFQRGAHRS